MKVNFERWGETILGAVVAVVAIGFFAFAAAQAGQTGASEGYDLTARFQRIDGINVGSDVRISGVKVGVVRAVALDNETYLARVTMCVFQTIQRRASPAMVCSAAPMSRSSRAAWIPSPPAGKSSIRKAPSIF